MRPCAPRYACDTYSHLTDFTYISAILETIINMPLSDRPTVRTTPDTKARALQKHMKRDRPQHKNDEDITNTHHAGQHSTKLHKQPQSSSPLSKAKPSPRSPPSRNSKARLAGKLARAHLKAAPELPPVSSEPRARVIIEPQLGTDVVQRGIRMESVNSVRPRKGDVDVLFFIYPEPHGKIAFEVADLETIKDPSLPPPRATYEINEYEGGTTLEIQYTIQRRVEPQHSHDRVVTLPQTPVSDKLGLMDLSTLKKKAPETWKTLRRSGRI